MQIDPQTLSHSERYKLLIGAIVPRPIALVSSLSPDGRPNLAPFSFFNGVCGTPMMLMFCPANRGDGTEKDTLRNAKPAAEGGLGEFVVNIVPHAIRMQMAVCAEELPHGESEFDLSGLTAAPAVKVRPARVAESPVSLECITDRVVRMAPGEPSGGNIVIGRVVLVHAREGLVNERRHVDAAGLDAIGRMGGLGYCTTRDRFEMPMGRGALEPL